MQAWKTQPASDLQVDWLIPIQTAHWKLDTRQLEISVQGFKPVVETG